MSEHTDDEPFEDPDTSPDEPGGPGTGPGPRAPGPRPHDDPGPNTGPGPRSPGPRSPEQRD